MTAEQKRHWEHVTGTGVQQKYEISNQTRTAFKKGIRAAKGKLETSTEDATGCSV
jgi:hypothetical protein